jgi:hypothetical protein
VTTNNSLFSQVFDLPSEAQKALLKELSFRHCIPLTEEFILREKALEAAVKVAQQTKENVADLAYNIYGFLVDPETPHGH